MPTFTTTTATGLGGGSGSSALAVALNRGPNAGISGDVSFPTVAGTWSFKIYVVGEDWDLGLLDDAGRGDGKWPAQIPGNASGTIVLSGLVTKFAFPNPTALNGQILTVTNTLYTGVTETMTVRVLKRGVSHDEAKGENWNIRLTCQIIDMPTSAGWPGSQVASNDDVWTDKRLWNGMSKTLDPATVDLASTATERLRIWGTADTDDAEIAAIQAHFTDTYDVADTGLDGLKLRPIGFTRASANVAYLQFQWSWRNTNDDVLNPQTIRHVDPNSLSSYEKTTALNGTPGAGSITGLVDRGITFIKHHDAATQQVKEWGTRSTIQDITFPGTVTNDDASDLSDTKSITVVTTSATPVPGTAPTGYSLRSTHSTQLTDYGSWQHRFEYGRRTTAEDVTMEGSHTTTDPSNLGDEIVVTSIQANDTISFATYSGYSSYSATARQIHGQSTAKWRVTYVYRRLNAEEAIEHEGTSASASNATPQTTTGITQVETVVEGCTTTATAQALALAAQSTYFNTEGYAGLTATKINKTKVQYRIIRQTDDLMIMESGPTTREESTGTLYTYGAAINAATARIVDSVQVAASIYRKMLGEVSQWVTYKSIIVRRRKTGIDNADDVRYRGGEGAVNTDTFLGYPAGTVQFCGSSQETSWKSVIESAAHTQQYDLHFLYRSVGFWGSSSIPMGRWFNSSSTHAPGTSDGLSGLKSGWGVDLPPYMPFGTGTYTYPSGTVTLTVTGANFLG